MLNEYFELMVDIALPARGHARQVRRRRDHGAVRRAGRTCPTRRSRGALRARDAEGAAEFNRTRVAEGQEPIQIGIGINTGEVVAGAIGSSKALAVHGHRRRGEHRLAPVLDRQGRARSSCRSPRCGACAEHVDAAALPPVKVKGKEQELQIYNVARHEGREWRQERTRPM